MIPKKIFLLETTSLPINKFVLAILQLGIMVAFTIVFYHFSFSHDWKRWLPFFSMLVVFKMILDLSITVTNIIYGSNYRLGDVASKRYNSSRLVKRASYVSGIMMIMLIGIHVVGFNKFEAYMDDQLIHNGVSTSGVVENVYWHTSTKKRNTGYKIDYYYIVKDKRYNHNAFLGERPEFSIIKIKYLPTMPDKHTFELIK